MLKHFVTPACLLCTAITTYATETFLRHVVNSLTPETAVFDAIYSDNAAAMVVSRDYSITTVVANGAIEKRDEAFCIEEGRDRHGVTAGVNSFIVIDSLSAAFGHAIYSSTTVSCIKWNNSTDYHRVAPYVLGDSVGGNLSSRSYRFAGGYSRIAGKWTWGAHADYRASMSHRNRDPRLKIVVSDLTVDAGITRRLNSGSRIGLSLLFNTYRQESDVDFYNPVNDIRTYALTGLGSVYNRFSGSSIENTAYNGLAWKASVQYLSPAAQSPDISLSYSTDNITQLLRDFNNLDLASTSTSSIEAHLIYTIPTSGPRLSFIATAQLCDRSGTENLFGTSAGNQYEKIATRRNYRHRTATGSLEIPLTVGYSSSMSDNSFSIVPHTGLFSSDEQSIITDRQLKVTALSPGATIRYCHIHNGKWSGGISADATATLITSRSAKLNGLDRNSSLGNTILHDFEMISDESIACILTATWQRSLNSDLLLGFNLHGSMISYRHHGDAYAVNLDLVFTF